MTFPLFVSGILVPACVVLAYKCPMALGFWGNIAFFYSLASIGTFLAHNGIESPVRAVIGIVIFSPVFIALVFAGGWLERRLTRNGRVD